MALEEEHDNIVKAETEPSILDQKVLRIFGYPLTITQQVWMGFMLPTILSTFVFVANFAFSFAVAFQLLRDGHPCFAGVTVLLIYAASLICLVVNIMHQPKLDSLGDSVIWMLVQVLQTMLFPVSVMHRFATQIFWSVVALTEDDPSRERALRTAAASHQIAMFFLVDSFVNAGPQAVLQTYILLSPQIFVTHTTAWTQAGCIVTSVLTLAKTAALYQRYESQKIAGRIPPWRFDHSENHSKALVKITKIDPFLLMGFHQDMKLQRGRTSHNTSNLLQDQSETNLQPQEGDPPSEVPELLQKELQQRTDAEEQDKNSSSEVSELLQQEQQQSTETDQEGKLPSEVSQLFQQTPQLKIEAELQEFSFQEALNVPPDFCQKPTLHDSKDCQAEPLVRANERPNPLTQDGETESKELDALLHNQEETQQTNVSGTSSHYLEPITIQNEALEERCFWPRITTPPSTPTADPHMRPRLSINTIRSQNRPAYTSQVKVVISTPRTKGLHEDEMLGIFTALTAWAPYLLARILVIAAFANFYLWAALGLLLCHYIIMVTYLFFCSPYKVYLAPLLGFVFVLFPIEINIRYKNPRAFIILFFGLVFLENLSILVLWYYKAAWQNWWYNFVFYFIICCHGIAALNATLYFCLFKPKAKYIN